MSIKAYSIFLLIPIILFLTGNKSKAQNQSYFQQEVNYKIQVKLDDKAHFLRGNIEIEYTNNSPEQLDFIYFHIWPNAYKNNQTALAKQKARTSSNPPDFTKEKNRGFIDSLDFTVNGNNLDFEYHQDHIDICKVKLNEPIEHNETITIKTPFRVKIPHAKISRFGHMGQAYKITQWYPKPAVYDHKGWHEMPYLDMGEFYSEFGSFEVSITIPENYVVAATGNLQTEKEKQWLEKKVRETQKLKNPQEATGTTPESSSEFKTLVYKEDNIHDFAWFADKDYLVLKDTAKLPDSKRNVHCWAFFRAENYKQWKKAPGYIKDAIHYFSRWYGDYPYDNCTAILNPRGARGGGMEYPTITAIGQSNNDFFLETVIMHEVGHNWFYSILGFNEREHPWMDEGINTFSEIRYMQEKYKDTNAVSLALGEFVSKALSIKDLEYKNYHKFSYLMSARQQADQPATLHSVDFKPMNYGSIVYSKTGMAIFMLMNYLGEDKFNEIMQNFYNTWKFKHPYPEDFENAFKTNTSKNVDWFFETAIGSDKKMDYKVKRIKDNELLVKNKANGEMPFPVTGIQDNNAVFTRWYDGFDNKKWLSLPDKEFDRLYIDYYQNTLEFNGKNNYIKSKGIFKKLNPISLNFVGPLEQPHYAQINFLPVVGYNHYNKFMAGMHFHSSYFPPDNFQYNLTPLYSFGTNDIAGSGNFSYTFYPNSTFKDIKIDLSGLKYAYNSEKGDYFDKIHLKADFNLNPSGQKERIYNTIYLDGIYATDVGSIILSPADIKHKTFFNLKYYYSNYENQNPINTAVGFEFSDNFIKASMVSKHTLKVFPDKKKNITLRLFGGTFLSKDMVSSPYFFHLSGATGWQDYTFDKTFLGRFEVPGVPGNNQFFSQQFVKNEGGFAIYTPFGRTDDWILSLNTNFPLPFISDFLPIKGYGNIASFGNSYNIPGYNPDNFAWETGLRMSLFNAVKIYFPAFMSDYINQYSNDITDNYWQKIRFSVELKNLLPSF
jgi:hypothetical protein